MKKAIVCPACGYIGLPKRDVKGNGGVELILWLCFLIPGIIYSLWRSGSRYNACPVCGSTTLVPIDSPNGAKLLEAQGRTVDQVKTEIKNTPMPLRNKILIGAGIAVVGLILLSYVFDAMAKH